MEIRLYFRMLLKGWWIILLFALASLTASLVVSYLVTPQYQGVARFVVTPSGSLSQGEVFSSLSILDRRSVVATVAEVMNSQRILTMSQEAMKLPPEIVEDFLDKYTILAVVLPEAAVLEITVTGPNPNIVSELPNVMGQQTILFARSLNFPYDLNFLDPATLPSEPISPQPLRDAGIALVLGIIAGAAFAIVNEQMRTPLEVYRQRLRVDSTTGVYKDHYFRQLLDGEIAKNPDGVLSIGIVSLNGLSDLIETLPLSGLQVLLQNVTQTLRRELRGNDIIGRWDETSFIVMLPTTPIAAAKSTFDRISQALSRTVTLEAYDVAVNLEPCVGGAVFSNDISPQELLAKAESSLVQAQTSVESSVFVWEMNSPFWVEK